MQLAFVHGIGTQIGYFIFGHAQHPFLACGLPFEHKATHGHIEHNAQKSEVDHRGAAAVADEGQGNAHHRHEPDDHAHIDQNLPEKIEEVFSLNA